MTAWPKMIWHVSLYYHKLFGTLMYNSTSSQLLHEDSAWDRREPVCLYPAEDLQSVNTIDNSWEDRVI